MSTVKYTQGQVFESVSATFFIHYVVDPQRILLRWRLSGQISVQEQTMSEVEIDHLFESRGAIQR